MADAIRHDESVGVVAAAMWTPENASNRSAHGVVIVTSHRLIFYDFERRRDSVIDRADVLSAFSREDDKVGKVVLILDREPHGGAHEDYADEQSPWTANRQAPFEVVPSSHAATIVTILGEDPELL